MKRAILSILFALPFLASVSSLKCYVCAWTATHCQDFNCYNNPDVCSNNNFGPTVVHPTECPAGCETFVITDPNGLVQQWRRNCDTSGVTYGQEISGASRCKTEYQFGIRLDRCTCNADLCNSTSSVRASLVLIALLAGLTLIKSFRNALQG